MEHLLFCLSAPPHSNCSDLLWLQELSDDILGFVGVTFIVGLLCWITWDNLQ